MPEFFSRWQEKWEVIRAFFATNVVGIAQIEGTRLRIFQRLIVSRNLLSSTSNPSPGSILEDGHYRWP